MHDMRIGTCALCGHDEVVAAEARDFYGEWGERHEPMALTEARQFSAWSGKETDRANPEKRFGALTQYMCRACGYVQWFVSEPGKVPIGDEYRTKLVKGARGAPYR